MNSNNITIWLYSTVTETAKKCLAQIRELNQLAKNNVVELEFYGGKCTVIGKRRRVYNVPQKAANDPGALCEYIKNRISTAWPE